MLVKPLKERNFDHLWLAWKLNCSTSFTQNLPKISLMISYVHLSCLNFTFIIKFPIHELYTKFPSHIRGICEAFYKKKNKQSTKLDMWRGQPVFEILFREVWVLREHCYWTNAIEQIWAKWKQPKEIIFLLTICTYTHMDLPHQSRIKLLTARS